MTTCSLFHLYCSSYLLELKNLWKEGAVGFLPAIVLLLALLFTALLMFLGDSEQSIVINEWILGVTNLVVTKEEAESCIACLRELYPKQSIHFAGSMCHKKTAEVYESLGMKLFALDPSYYATDLAKVMSRKQSRIDLKVFNEIVRHSIVPAEAPAPKKKPSRWGPPPPKAEPAPVVENYKYRYLYHDELKALVLEHEDPATAVEGKITPNNPIIRKIRELFSNVFVVKYPTPVFNFTDVYFANILETKMMEMAAVQSLETKELVLVYAVMDSVDKFNFTGNWFGRAEQTEEDSKQASYYKFLYCCTFLNLKKKQLKEGVKEFAMNYGGSCDGFKLIRGLEAHPTGYFIYSQHLSLLRRIAWSIILNVQQPMMSPLWTLVLADIERRTNKEYREDPTNKIVKFLRHDVKFAKELYQTISSAAQEAWAAWKKK